MTAGPRHTPDGRYIVVKGRRWRAQDPELPAELTERLLSHLGRNRSALSRVEKSDAEAVSRLRTRVTWAKEGLGERGTCWWDMNVEDRIARAEQRLERLDEDPGQEAEH